VSQVATVGDVTALDERPPHNPEAERAILGAVLWNNHCFYRVVTIIRIEDFFRDAHRLIFQVMEQMVASGVEIDLVTLKDEIGRRGWIDRAGGRAYISSLVDGVPDIVNVERYAHIVKEHSQLRRLMLMGSKIIQAAKDSPQAPGEVLAIAEKSLYEIADGSIETGFVGLDRVTRINMTAIEQANSAGRLITGLPTGYDRFNELTSGFQPAELIIIAARPAMGKTSFLTNIAESIALPGRDGEPRNGTSRLYSVGFFSLEMSKEQIGLRILSSESHVPNHIIRAGMLSERNWRDLAEASARLAKAKIFIDDSPSIDPMEMRAKARRLKREASLDIVMVDYLQLMSIKGRIESRQQEISQISRSLKRIAKELNVPLISLSQLSRRPEQRTGDHRPQLSDLRESGAIEQDADLVAFIYRDEVYNKETEDKGIAEIIIAKQRNGPIGDFKLVFRNDITKFFNYEPLPDIDYEDDRRYR
jgi:replicative DNA helicase